MKSTKPAPKVAPKDENKDANTVYISNLSYQLDREDLRRLFSNFGEVRQVKLLIDQETQQSKGMAFIRMASPEQAKKAIKLLDRQILEGRTVKVAPAIPMKAAPSPFPKEKTIEPAARPKREKQVMIEPKGEPKKSSKKGPVGLKDFLAQKAAGMIVPKKQRTSKP